MEPYYYDGLVTIYYGDNAEVVPQLGQFDMVFTSPPYNLGGSPWPHLSNWKPEHSRGKSKWENSSAGSGGITYIEHEDAMPWDEYVSWQRRSLYAMWDRLTPVGAIFYNHKTRLVGGRLWKPDELIPDDLTVRQEIIWARAGGLNYNPTAYVPMHERIYVIAREAWRLKSKGASGLGDVWRLPQESGTEHPAPFPVGLPARAIESAAPTSVLDPFAGGGSTLVAAKAAGVRAVGVEISERYCEIAARRLAQGVLFGETA